MTNTFTVSEKINPFNGSIDKWIVSNDSRVITLDITAGTATEKGQYLSEQATSNVFTFAENALFPKSDLPF